MTTLTHSVLSALLLYSSTTFAFSEDSSVSGESKSSAHYDVTLAFGRCLNLPQSDIQAIAIANQTADSLTFQGLSLDFTARTSANAAYFHSPQSQLSVDALAELKKWADPSNLNKAYVPSQLPLVTDQVKSYSGTLTAFGVYLHALGDHYSHLACTDAGYVPHCGGAFGRCENRTERNFCHYNDAHDDEFGTDPTLTANTKEGLRKTYSALAERYGKTTTLPSEIETFIKSFAETTNDSTRVTLASSLCPSAK